MKNKHSKNGENEMRDTKREIIYREMCYCCSNEKKCHEECITCEKFDNAMEKPLTRPYSELSHQECMQIYNNKQFGMYTIKELCERLNITWYTYHKAIEKTEKLIREKLENNGSIFDKKPKTCYLCGGQVILNRCNKEQSRSGWVYYCKNCHAWVGTSPKQYDEALGFLATKELRKARVELHRWFDKLWKNHKERDLLYRELAKELGIEECHFSQLNFTQIENAKSIIKKWWLKKFDI